MHLGWTDMLRVAIATVVMLHLLLQNLTKLVLSVKRLFTALNSFQKKSRLLVHRRKILDRKRHVLLSSCCSARKKTLTWGKVGECRSLLVVVGSSCFKVG
jgi:hypothetical protein